MSMLFVCLALLADATPSAPATTADLAAYEAARTHAGRDPEAHVRLALWCEAHGLKAERTKHLAMAVMLDPANATARGLLGLVAYRNRWQRPEAVGEQVKADEALSAALAEYNSRRARLANTADAHWRLALWCEEQGLKAEARAHLATVVRLDPGRDAAWKRLGCKKYNGHWMTEAEIAAAKAEAEAQSRADKKWRPLLLKLRSRLAERSRQQGAQEELAGITDPRAVPAISAVFAAGGPALQAIAVRLFGQIESPASSRSLALLAVFGASPEVRRLASETLQGRDAREFVPLLIARLRDPIKYEVRPVGGPGSPGALFVAGDRFNVQRLYAPPPLPSIPYMPDAQLSYDVNGLPVISRTIGTVEEMTTKRAAASQLSGSTNEAALRGLASVRGGPNTAVRVARQQKVEIPIGEMIVEAQQSALVAQAQLKHDVDAVEAFNSSAREINGRILPLLQSVSGQDLGESQDSWSRWWIDNQGYAAAPRYDGEKPTVVENVPLGFVPTAVPVLAAGPIVGVAQHSCFGSGTQVATLTGLRPIETIRVGDQVLTQDGTSGALSYQPVVAVYHNRPSPTLRLKLGGEDVVATGIHRFWRAGHGWAMARELKAGDQVRTLNDVVSVTSVENERVQPVFNLKVAKGASFFVGTSGVLVHDNSLVEPVNRPFDAAPSLAAASPAASAR